MEGTPPPHDSEFAHYASMYREALNSNSSVYRFLCSSRLSKGSEYAVCVSEKKPQVTGRSAFAQWNAFLTMIRARRHG